MVAWRRRSILDLSRDLRPWLLGVGYRQAANWRALAQHHFEVAEESTAHSHAITSRAEDQRDAKVLLNQALAAMSFDVRTVFVLHELEERPIPEIACLMGCPEGTAYSRLRSARKVLADVREAWLREGGSA